MAAQPPLGAGSTPIRKYMDGKISSTEYFREVRKSTSRDVRRELKEQSPKGDDKR